MCSEALLRLFRQSEFIINEPLKELIYTEWSLTANVSISGKCPSLSSKRPEFVQFQRENSIELNPDCWAVYFTPLRFLMPSFLSYLWTEKS